MLLLGCVCCLQDDPFQMKTGGMVDMKKLKERGKDK